MSLQRTAAILLTTALLLPTAVLAQAPKAKPVPPLPQPVTVLTLERARQLTLANNPNVKALQESVKQAEIMRWRAYAILLPYLMLDASVTRADKEMSLAFPDFEGLMQTVVGGHEAQYHGAAPPPPMGEGEKTIIQELWGQHFGFTANITLFNAQSIPLVKGAWDNIEAARLMERHQRNQLLFAVTAAYYAAHMADEAVRIAQADVATAEEFHRMTERRRAVGTGVKIDVLKAQIAMSTARKAVADAEDSLRLAKASVAYLTGFDGDFVTRTPPRPSAPAAALPDLQRKALEERLDIRAARVQAGIAERQRELTWTKFAPSFDLTYNHAWDSATGFGGEHTSWRLIFGAKWNLLQGGQRIAELDEKASQIRQAHQQISALGVTIREDVEKAAVALAGKQRNLTLVAEQLKLAEESAKLVSTTYARGMSTGVDLLDANQTLSKARRAQLLETFQHDLALVMLEQALGVELSRR